MAKKKIVPEVQKFSATKVTSFVRPSDDGTEVAEYNMLENKDAYQSYIDKKRGELGMNSRQKVGEEEDILRKNLSAAGKIRIDEAGLKNKNPYAIQPNLTKAQESKVLEFANAVTGGNASLIVEMADSGYSVYGKEYSEFGRIKVPGHIEFAEYQNKKKTVETADKK